MTMYEKCRYCHLFIEHNSEHDTYPDLAKYNHLHRGDGADEEIISTHDATPSGIIHSLDWWKECGPVEMIERFTEMGE